MQLFIDVVATVCVFIIAFGWLIDRYGGDN
jgi:hypothetical protein